MENESVSRCRYPYQIQICIPAHVMSSEFLGRASYYTVRVDKIALKTLFYIKSKKTEQAEISEL